MTKLIFAAAAVAIAAVAQAAPAPVHPDSTGFKFTDVAVVKTNPVRNQASSGTCWCFSSNSFFENELIRKTGSAPDLSEMFVVWHTYDDKADKYIRMNGKLNYSQGGSGLDVPYVWATYGAVPEEVFAGLNYGEDTHKHSEMEAALQGYLNGVGRKGNRRLSTAWRKGLQGILNAYLGEIPETFTYQGKTYTPQSFAASLPIDVNDYVAITSFTHHPFYQPFGLEVSDNWVFGQYMNLPLEEMKAVVDNALDNGYSVLWAADVSEPGFKWNQGYAVLPAETNEADLEGTELSRWVKLTPAEKQKERYNIKGPVKEETVTQESRQAMFDRQETTDDHGMVIVGRATDQQGNRYYKVQNSWDTNQVYNGYFYVSEPYFLAKTMDIYVNKEAVPAAIAKKAGIKK